MAITSVRIKVVSNGMRARMMMLEKLKNLFSEQPQKEEPPVESTTKKRKGSSKCSHHFGCLRKLPKGRPIPQECLTCQKLLECRNTI